MDIRHDMKREVSTVGQSIQLTCVSVEGADAE